MPKKFKGENSKAQEARARKAAQKEEEHQKKKKAEEDALWQDDDKHVAKKQQRKEDREKKRIEALERKKELKELEEQEMSSIKSAKPAPAAKVTRAQISVNRERMVAAEAAARPKKPEETEVAELPLEENINRLEIEGEARSIEKAISVLSEKEAELDRHPEKRMKAAYKAFEEENLPRLKVENPNLRLSQLKQMLKKDWMKSPQNPMVQLMAS